MLYFFFLATIAHNNNNAQKHVEDKPKNGQSSSVPTETKSKCNTPDWSLGRLTCKLAAEAGSAAGRMVEKADCSVYSSKHLFVDDADSRVSYMNVVIMCVCACVLFFATCMSSHRPA